MAMVDSPVENFDLPDDPGAEFLANLTRFIEEMEKKREAILGGIPNQPAFYSALYRGNDLFPWPRIRESEMQLHDYDI